MSYNTYYSLKWEIKEIRYCDHNKPNKAKYCPECGTSLNKKSFEWSIDEYIEKKGWYYFIDGNIGNWWDYEKDMKTLSERFPTVLFILEGHGEDLGTYDIWRVYAFNGELQEYRGQVSFPDFKEKSI